MINSKDADTATGRASDVERQDELHSVVRRLGGKRALVAAILPNALEFYDFYIFGLLAPVLAKAFFPSRDSVAGLLYVSPSSPWLSRHDRSERSSSATSAIATDGATPSS